MKNPTKFVVQLLTAAIIAAIISTLVVVILSFVIANVGSFKGSEGTINFVGGAIFGLMLGYRLNTLINPRKK